MIASNLLIDAWNRNALTLEPAASALQEAENCIGVTFGLQRPFSASIAFQRVLAISTDQALTNAATLPTRPKYIRS
ncbi:hypothetical protein [Rhizobium leucaenae]|uniref:Uncharacterized protein n=1 Tax=Rhizobium leucaenae TaxID=29450 RepID=A0A7W7ENN7_9HYPH|nr:hypothetical protein [Rhizobium leucaenae]MBB4571799.1 hypothetical protein [Rhizobium leucaenae]MBB6305712.1 hypothetical protein [Rhizobium leucaenae]